LLFVSIIVWRYSWCAYLVAQEALQKEISAAWARLFLYAVWCERMVSSSASSSTPSSPHSRMPSPSRETLDGITSSLEAARAALSVVHAHEDVRALIPTKTRTYLAPGGDYSFLNFTHEYGCRNALAPEFDELVRRAVITAAPATTKEVELIVRGFLMGKDCSATCGLDKDSTTGL